MRPPYSWFITEWPRLCLKIQLQQGTLRPTSTHGHQPVCRVHALAKLPQQIYICMIAVFLITSTLNSVLFVKAIKNQEILKDMLYKKCHQRCSHTKLLEIDEQHAKKQQEHSSISCVTTGRTQAAISTNPPIIYVPSLGARRQEPLTNTHPVNWQSLSGRSGSCFECKSKDVFFDMLVPLVAGEVTLHKSDCSSKFHPTAFVF